MSPVSPGLKKTNSPEGASHSWQALVAGREQHGQSVSVLRVVDDGHHRVARFRLIGRGVMADDIATDQVAEYTAHHDVRGKVAARRNAAGADRGRETIGAQPGEPTRILLLR